MLNNAVNPNKKIAQIAIVYFQRIFVLIYFRIFGTILSCGWG